ncbi:MAG TPA: hypothetical protein VH333_04165 [Pseudonocardiaceae bacterium]|nr:hypothetical protein [Pseudonocardiaceae bacterium]
MPTTVGRPEHDRKPAPRVTARGAGTAAVLDPVGLAVLTRRDLTAPEPVAFHTERNR